MTDIALSLQDVSVMRGGLPVTHSVSFDVLKGQITALIGPNGAGKSSLVLAAAGGLDATGSIRFGERELLGLASDKIRRLGVAAVPEGHNIFNGLSVADNLAAAASSFPRSETQPRIDAVLETLPELRALLDRQGGVLSGGEQQMVAIGQGLVCRPEVLIVDELSLGLAPIIVDRLLVLLSKLASTGTAVLLIEQFTAKALDVATSAHVISGGQLTYSGQARELVDDPTIIHEAYLGSAEASPHS